MWFREALTQYQAHPTNSTAAFPSQLVRVELYHKPCCVNHSLNTVVNMVIHPNHLSPKTINQTIHRKVRRAIASHSSRTASPEAAQVSISQNVWLSSLRNTLDNQYSSAEHCPFLSVYLYEHSVRHTIFFYFSRARISRASPRGLCGTRVSSND